MRLFFTLLFTALVSLPVHAQTMTIYLQEKSGQQHPIGTLTLTPLDGHFHYQITMHHQVFTDYFLSMKEMKCLEGPELWCHLAYPYHSPRTVTHQSLDWLSHDLLFMFKEPSAFGANFWNGIYYELEWQGDQITGSARAVDLNELAAPPEEQDIPPFTQFEREPAEREKRWLPDIVIR